MSEDKEENNRRYALDAAIRLCGQRPDYQYILDIAQAFEGFLNGRVSKPQVRRESEERSDTSKDTSA